MASVKAVIEGVGLEKTFVNKRGVRDILLRPLHPAKRTRALRGVDLDVREGEIFGLLGPNGAGKTTSFRSTIGMITPDSGEVSFDGMRVTNLPMYKRARLGMGYLPQEASVFRRLSARH